MMNLLILFKLCLWLFCNHHNSLNVLYAFTMPSIPQLATSSIHQHLCTIILIISISSFLDNIMTMYIFHCILCIHIMVRFLTNYKGKSMLWGFSIDKGTLQSHITVSRSHRCGTYLFTIGLPDHQNTSNCWTSRKRYYFFMLVTMCLCFSVYIHTYP